jgi:DNA processing protein
MLTDELLLAWWRLRRLSGIGNIALNDIRQNLASAHHLADQAPKQLTDASLDDLIRLGLPAAKAEQYFNDEALSAGFEALIEWCAVEHQGVLLAGIPPYPEALASLRDAPTLLWYRGDLNSLNAPMLAIVGSRGATPAALEWTRHAAASLAEAGLCIVSGLALGIDGAAHAGAVLSGQPSSTVAVMGTGPDLVYPARHRQLAQDIYHSGGLLLTEFAPGTKAQARHFPSRNRIISGLSVATLVVEAGIRSGTMITARMAADHGRDVFALPGAIANPMSKGPHQLIREGALLVESAKDILEALSLPLHSPTSTADLFDQNTDNKPVDIPPLVTLVDYTPTAVDVIAIRSEYSIAELMPQLLQLELDGWLLQVPGGYCRTS